MDGKDRKLKEFVAIGSAQFIIPVYQRKYDWRIENCQQLFHDLIKLSYDNAQKLHFFGSIVTARADDYSDNRLIIDGQQRLTTVSLLLLAAIKAVKAGNLSIDDNKRIDEAYDFFLNAKYCNSPRKIKLVPVEEDLAAYDYIYNNDEEHFVANSNMTTNFLYFYNLLIQKPQNITFDKLLDAIERLLIIDIKLGDNDDAQLIFESLNSKGVPLEESDKVRNYMLMSLSPKEQQDYFQKYWHKIELLLGKNITMFLRDYLTIRQQLNRPVRQANIYKEWKKYMEGKDRREEIQQMLHYATYFRMATHAELRTPKLSAKMRHICNIESDVLNVFFVQFFIYADKNELEDDEIYKVIDIIENFMARRIVCNLPSNALTQVFCTLYRDVLKSIEEYQRADKTINATFSEILTYHILRREGNYGIPRDIQFTEAIRTRDAYHMLKPFQIFLFERLENAIPGEYIDVATEMRDKIATIEHIMPQTIGKEWKQMLGADWEEVQRQYLHTFANLTLTGINSGLSNKPFPIKRDGEFVNGEYKPGYKDSKYRMTRDVTLCQQWTAHELQSRADKIVTTFVTLYPMLQTTFKPLPKPIDEVSLEDESFSPTNREIKGFRLMETEYEENNWVSMLLHVVALISEKYPDIVESLYDKGAFFWSAKKAEKRYCTEISKNRYLWTSVDNKGKLRCLRYLFDKCNIPESDLTFLLVPQKIASSNI